MLPSILLSLREGIEAVLVLSLVLGGLRKINRTELSVNVWKGALTGLVGSAAVAVVLNILGSNFTGVAESAFEGLTMLLAAGILTWMIFWMQRQGRAMKGEIETSVRKATLSRGGRGLFVLSFLAVIREGIELALYLLAARLASSVLQTAVGAVLGLAAAFGIGWLIFATSYRFNLKRFFLITNILLIFFAAGLVTNSAHELIETGWIPAGIAQVWNLNNLLAQNSAVGQILNALLGYNSQPSLTEVLAYIGYIAAIACGIFLARLRFFPGKREGSKV